ncbi:MAG: hypothetical protein HOI53_05335 [Francisellaceae bacterium]|jgi:heme exporter protein B|nr:hypothetical protein [Francisellaceae bacterium]MBT6207429.1 hypothetical protein [Francisellaceae bacterium]MBT6537992.1 hypothetical protein [Francisellaceae bacterium]
MIKFGLLKESKLKDEHLFSSVLLIANTILVFMLFNLCVPQISDTMSIGLLWVSLVLTLLTIQEVYFNRDKDAGTYALVALSPKPNYGLLLKMFFLQWLVLSIPILVAAFFGAVLCGWGLKISTSLMMVAALSTWSLCIIGWFANVLSLNLNTHAKVLQLIIVIPLYLPVLIFGASAHLDCMGQVNPLANLAMLTAIAIIFGMLIPLAISYFIDEGVISL